MDSLAIVGTKDKCGCQWLLESGQIVAICSKHEVRTLQQYIESIPCECIAKKLDVYDGIWKQICSVCKSDKVCECQPPTQKDHGGRDRCTQCWKVREGGER